MSDPHPSVDLVVFTHGPPKLRPEDEATFEAWLDGTHQTGPAGPETARTNEAAKARRAAA